ncbi:trans-sialidase, partial [Trypanosoma cruzi]
SRREYRKSLPTSERRIDVLLLKLQQSAHVRPQYEGACPTCSTWRSDSWRGPHMRVPQWCQRLLNRRLAHRSPQKVPSMPAGKTRRKHKRGHSRWTTRDFASSTAEMPPSLGIGNASVWECPSPHDGTCEI